MDSCGRYQRWSAGYKMGSVKMRVLSCVTTSSGRRQTGTGATSVKVVNGGEVDSEEHVSSGKAASVV